MPNDWSVRILVPVVAGLFALLGSFAGAWWARRTEYEKWLRQNRSEVYTKFLELLAKARNDASNILFDRSLEDLPQSIKVTEAYLPAMEYGRIVRLYLPRTKREKFRELSHSYFALHSQKSLGDSRLTTMAKKLDQIQQIFEDTL